MGFSNPLTGPVSIDPNSIVAGVSGNVAGSTGSILGSSIGARVPYLGVDALYWPQISGQQFAPTLGGATYGGDSGAPCIKLTSTSQNATFPFVPRYSGTKQKATVTFRVRFTSMSNTGIDNGAVIFAFNGNGTGAGKCTVTYEATGKLHLNINGVDLGTFGTYAVGTYDVTAIFNADGSVDMTIGANRIVSAAGAINPDIVLQPDFRTTTSGSTFFNLFPLAVQYS